ncbi:hypothetical protein FOL47_010088 [Perkinsus chesapeaki]|uniref:Uncharacterized protein n=1 Tax=Perkinsus chesapeaki TaxID=330153 RepID=A0A7J6L4V5_PERCH|nr:hypothetical protein FOL47_010088 [Perkinsus chesapeaki]
MPSHKKIEKIDGDYKERLDKYRTSSKDITTESGTLSKDITPKAFRGVQDKSGSVSDLAPLASPSSHAPKGEHVTSRKSRVPRIPCTMSELDELTAANITLTGDENPTRNIGVWILAPKPLELMKDPIPSPHLADELLCLDTYAWHPTGGRCPYSSSPDVRCFQVKRSDAAYSQKVGKVVYRVGWPYLLVYCELRCGTCNKHFCSIDASYIASLPYLVQTEFPCFVPGDAKGIDRAVLQPLRSGTTFAASADSINHGIFSEYCKRKQIFEAAWSKALSNGGVGSFWDNKPSVAPRFPEMPGYKVSEKFTKAVFLADFNIQK